MTDPLLPIPHRYARLCERAERDPRRAVALARRAYTHTVAEDHLEVAWATFTLGWCLLRWERIPEAAVLLQAAHDHSATLNTPFPILYARLGLIVVELMRGSGPELQDRCNDLASAYAAHGLTPGAVRVRFEQAAHLNLLGRSREALDFLDSLAPLVEHSSNLADYARLARLRGVAFNTLGRLNEAETHLDTAIAGFAHLRWQVQRARSLFERAWVAQRREQFDAALAMLTQAQAIFQRLDMPRMIAFCRKDEALAASRLGRIDQTIVATLEAQALFVAEGHLDLVARCDLNLGNSAYYVGLFDLALAVYRRAHQTYQALGIRHMALITLRNQALALRALGQPAEALTVLDEATALANQLGERLEQAEIAHARGLALRDQAMETVALAAFAEAETAFTALDNLPAAAESRLEQGWLHLDQHNPTAAADCFHAARPALIGRPGHLWRAAYGLGCVAEQQHQPATALALYREASAGVSRLRRRLASEHASSGLFVQARQLVHSALCLAFVTADPLALLELAEQQRALALQCQIANEPFAFTGTLAEEHTNQRQQLRTLVAQGAPLEQLDPALRSYIELLLQARHQQPLPDDLPSTSLDLATLRPALNRAYPAGWLVLVYVPLDEAIILVVIDASGEALTRITLNARLRKQLEQATLSRYRPYTYRDYPHFSGQTSEPWAILNALGEQLIPATVRARLHPDLRMLIVAGGALHGLPWGALRPGGAWLVEQTIPQLLPGLSLWPTLAARPTPGLDALLLGVSRFAGRAPDLPGALPTLDLVERHWPGAVTRLEDAAVNRPQLLAAAAAGELGRYGLVHIATHGQLVATRGLLAHLKLADDDLLYDEVARLKLGGALVVLAACEGAAGEVLPGEEVVSLTWALLAAGARDVIASQWQLYDRMVPLLLEPLYRNLAAGQDTPTALAQTQRSLLAQEHPHALAQEAASPFVWASLSAIGAGVVGAGATPRSATDDQ